MNKSDEFTAGVQRLRGTYAVTDVYLAAALGQSATRLRLLVDRHAERFPPDFAFALTADECGLLGTPGAERPVIAFTECGVSMLFMLLRTPLAAEICVTLMRRLRAFRRLVAANAEPLAPLLRAESEEWASTDEKARFAALYAGFGRMPPLNGVFLKRAFYAPRAALARLFAHAKQSIEIWDDCIPPLALDELARRRPEVAVRLVTLAKYRVAKSRLARLNARRQLVTVEYRRTIPCRVIILDGTQVFRLGRSLRDLGRKPMAVIRGAKCDILHL